MQLLSTTLTLTLALLQVARAQNDTKLSLVFSSVGAEDCGQSSNAGNPFSMEINSVPRSDVCFTFSDLLYGNYGNVTDSRTGYRDPVEPCPEDSSNCGIDYTLDRLGDSDPDVLYQQVFYQQYAATNSSSDDEIGQLELTTYPGSQCLADNPELGPWYAWTCNNEEGECSDTGSPIGSFSIGPVQEKWKNNGSCFVAAREADRGLAMGVPARLSLSAAMLSAMVITFM